MLHVDFESRGYAELRGSKSVGLWNYIHDSRTEPLMLNWAPDDEPIQTWQMHISMDVPPLLLKKLEDKNEPIEAYNSSFERYMFEAKFGIYLPIERFEDPQASARYLSLPANLDEVGTILGLPFNYAKDKRGKALIELFCKPHQTKKKKGEERVWYYNDWISHPKEWAEFVEYGRQDVVAQREVMRRERILGVWPLPPLERRIWEFDQTVNDRGIPIDREFATKAYELANREKKEMIAINNVKTGLENSNSNTQMLAWARLQGYDGMDPEIEEGHEDYPKYSLEKDIVKSQLKNNPNITTVCREALEIRKQTSSTTYKKLSTLLRQVCPDDRLRGQFIYMGSSRCGRWSGTGLQFHNMARPTEIFEDEENIDRARDMIYEMDYEEIKRVFGSVLLTVKSNIRTTFVTGPGRRFNVSDLNAIETRVGAWVAGCQSLLEGFRSIKDFDPYMYFASQMTQIPYEVLMADKKSKDPAVKAKAKHHRQIAKPGVLGCFGAKTRVLTNRGWVPIVEVQSTDLLFDGINWVSHDGVIDKGIKSVVEFNGVQVTLDHEVLINEGDWRSIWDVLQNTQLEKRAIGLASGLLSRANLKTKNTIMDLQRSRLSQINPDAEVLTYDILNSGPRNRFMVATDKGPIIAHNCIYRMGAPTLQEYAEAMGVIMSLEQAEEVVKIFRNAYREIVAMWFTLEEAIADVLGGERVTREVGPDGCIKISKFVFDCGGNFRTILKIQLPSGRFLHYVDASIESTKMPWKDRNTGADVYKDTLCYAAQDQKTKQWTIVTSHGGKVFENIVQGMARDVLAEKLLKFEEEELPVVLHVHDEGGSETEDSPIAPGLNEMDRIMAESVLWAPGLPLAADGFQSAYYHK